MWGLWGLPAFDRKLHHMHPCRAISAIFTDISKRSDQQFTVRRALMVDARAIVEAASPSSTSSRSLK